MSKIHIEIVRPSGKKLDTLVDTVIVPGVDGDFEIMVNHTPFITKVRPGTLITNNEGKEEKYAIHDGFITVENNEIIIISETIESKNEIDISRAEAAKDRAEKRLFGDKKDNVDFRRAEIALHRAIARINTIA